MDYDPFSPAAKESPEALFAELRRSCPVHHHVLPAERASRISENPLVANPTAEIWSVFRYDDVVGILHDTERFSSRQGPGPERLVPMDADGMLIYADDPAHMRQRRIAAKVFTPKSVRALEPVIQAIADDLVDGIVARGQAELMGDFAVPLTIRMIARMVGVSDDMVDDFWRWGNDTIAAFGGDAEAANRGFAAMGELFAYLGQIIAERREVIAAGGAPPEDFLTGMITADFEGERFSDMELLMACQQLMTAGFETTSTAIASAVYLLCTNAEQRALLEREPSLLAQACEEVLRYMAPVEGLFRTTREPVELAGTSLPADAKVRCVFASANRDERAFSRPDDFRIDRDEKEMRKHLAFGQGPHACIGAALARAEMRIALATLLLRLPGLALDPARPPVRNGALIVNGFSELSVTWTAAQPPRGADASLPTSVP